MRKSAILLVALSQLAKTSGGSGVTIEGESPVDILEEIEVGGVAIQTLDEVTRGGAKVETEDRGPG